MKRVLIKCGGSVIGELSNDFFASLHELKKQGYEVIIVHGGGPDINQMLGVLNVEPCYVDGLRKTDMATLIVVEMILSGKTNRKLVEKLYKNGHRALGLSGSDNQILVGNFVDKEQLGFVGEINHVNKPFLEKLLAEGIIPVLTPIAITEDGIKLNVNADYAAAAVAHALKADHCLFITDVEGIRINGKTVDKLNLQEITHYIESGEIFGGMIPKVDSAISAINKGLEEVMIVSGKLPFYQNGQFKGTKIVKEVRLVQ